MEVKGLDRNIKIRKAVVNMQRLIKLEKKKIELLEKKKDALMTMLVWEEAGGKGELNSSSLEQDGLVL